MTANQKSRQSSTNHWSSSFLRFFPTPGRLWELQFERSSGRGGAFDALTDSAHSSAELQVPGSLAAAVVKWPVELAQDDSWRMESGTGSGFVWNRGGWSLLRH